MQKFLKIPLILSFLFLMGQQSCQTTPSGKSGKTASTSKQRQTALPGDQGPNGSVYCGSPSNSFQCLMCNCHAETGIESRAGKLAVGKVVMTRVGMSSYPKSVCGVVYQRSQFSWTNQRKTRNFTLSGQNYRACYGVMREAYQFRGHYASHYHADYVHPGWRRRCRGRTKIDTHYFYSDCGSQPRAPEGQGARSVASLLSNKGYQYETQCIQ